MTQNQIKLAKALMFPEFRWRQRMLYRDTTGEHTVCHVREDGWLLLMGTTGWGNTVQYYNPAPGYPDISDPATRGILQQMQKEAVAAKLCALANAIDAALSEPLASEAREEVLLNFPDPEDESKRAEEHIKKVCARELSIIRQAILIRNLNTDPYSVIVAVPTPPAIMGLQYGLDEKKTKVSQGKWKQIIFWYLTRMGYVGRELDGPELKDVQALCPNATNNWADPLWFFIVYWPTVPATYVRHMQSW
jgi:hypothetical protein